MSMTWLYPLILVAGVMQAMGNSMNGALRSALTNPFFAATVSFGLIVFLFVGLFAVFPKPLPTAAGLEGMKWWAPLGGLTGAVAVFMGLLFVDRVGAGPFNGLLITANILASLAIDRFGWLGMQPHPLTAGRIAGGALMVAGIALIARF